MNPNQPAQATTGASDETFLADVIEGLSRPTKQLHPKYFYDTEGSRLFDRICELPEYYVTRTESAILEREAASMASAVGPGALVVEPGSGSSAKIGWLLDALTDPVAYAPVEIAGEHMMASLEPLRERFPELEILPVCADFTAGFQVPVPTRPENRRVLFFPGSTIGNFPPDEAVRLLTLFHEAAGPGGMLLLGADLRKDPAHLVPAYDDAAGVTAAFNRNLLYRLRRDLGADVDPDAFQHRAVWNAEAGRVEMHLVSTAEQAIRVGGYHFAFDAGEPIITEYSYKHTREELAALAARAGFRVEHVWSDAADWFSIQGLVRD